MMVGEECRKIACVGRVRASRRLGCRCWRRRGKRRVRQKGDVAVEWKGGDARSTKQHEHVAATGMWTGRGWCAGGRQGTTGIDDWLRAEELRPDGTRMRRDATD